jgi:hypothetical protein
MSIQEKQERNKADRLELLQGTLDLLNRTLKLRRSACASSG